jgi:hypothetical protein
MLRRALLWLAFAALLAPATSSAGSPRAPRAGAAGRPAHHTVVAPRPRARRPDRRAVGRRLARYRNVVISVRDARGMGDVAAAYLTAVDMVTRLGYPGTITIATPTSSRSDEPRRKLEHLAGQRIAKDGTLAGGRIRVIGLDRVPRGFPAVDLYIAASGVTATVDAPPGLPVHEGTVFVGQSVFGNTAGGEAGGRVRVGDRVTSLPPPGVAASEGGVYADPVALSLRGRSRAHVHRSLRAAVDRTVRAPRSRRALAALLDGGALAGSRRGVAYGGLSTPALSNQVATYLQGLVDDARTGGRSYALVVPKALDPALVAWPGLAGHVVAIDVAAGERLPRRAAAGTVYLLKMDPLPHEVFVGMMAAADAPPLIAGDGALSAAIVLRRPFVVASIEHNEQNNRAFHDRLLSASGIAHDRVLERIFAPRREGPRTYDTDASTALALESRRYRAIFAAAGRSIGTLTDHLVLAADAARAPGQ